MKNAKLNNSTFVLVLVIIGIVILSGFGFFKFYEANKKLRSSIPYLLPGEAISSFDVVGQDALSKNVSQLQSEGTSLIFIFSRPCSPCNKNIVYWRKIAEILGERVKVYGIVLGKIDETFELTDEVKLGFDVYVPENIGKFSDSLHIKLNFPQTIIYHNNKVVYQKMGELDSDEATAIIKAVNGLG